MISATPEPQGDGLLPPPVRRRWPEALSAGISAALFFAAFLSLPIVGPLALPFAAVPIVRLVHRRGLSVGLASAALVAALVFALGWATGGIIEAATQAGFAAGMTALPALFAGAAHRGLDPSRAYLALCGAGFLLLCVVLLARPTRMDGEMRREIDRGFDEWVRLSSQPGRPTVDAETAARLRVTLDTAREFCKRFWIGLIGVTWVLGSAIGFYTGAWAGRPATSALLARFEQLRLPAVIVPLFVASGACWALAPSLASRVAGNLLWPLVALYFVAGLSIICDFARRWFRARILRVGFYALAAYVPINVGVVLLGLFDWYFDFRRRGREIKES